VVTACVVYSVLDFFPAECMPMFIFALDTIAV